MKLKFILMILGAIGAALLEIAILLGFIPTLNF